LNNRVALAKCKKEPPRHKSGKFLINLLFRLLCEGFAENLLIIPFSPGRKSGTLRPIFVQDEIYLTSLSRKRQELHVLLPTQTLLSRGKQFSFSKGAEQKREISLAFQ
jgi:hypothetical protein